MDTTEDKKEEALHEHHEIVEDPDEDDETSEPELPVPLQDLQPSPQVQNLQEIKIGQQDGTYTLGKYSSFSSKEDCFTIITFCGLFILTCGIF